MAQKSLWWDTNGTGDGAANYTEAEWFGWLRRTFGGSGVHRGHANELAVSGTASPLSVATGAAVVYGSPYESDAVETLAVSTPAASTGGRVVLRSDWTAQTVRLAIKMSAGGVTAPPALTQTPNTTWEISLASFVISNTGVITLSDERGFLEYATNHVKRGGDTMSGNLTISNAAPVTRWNETDATANNRVWDVLVDTAKFFLRVGNDALSSFTNVLRISRSANAITEIDFLVNDVLRRNANKIWDAGNDGAGSGLDADLLDGLNSTAFLLLSLLNRRGGNASDWSIGGTSNYTIGNIRIQFGAAVPSAAAGSVTVTFPVAFSNKPVVLIGSGFRASPTPGNYMTYPQTISSSSVLIDFSSTADDTNPATYPIYWIALGPA